MSNRASAGARHLVWLVTLAALLLVPALTAWAPIPIRVLPAKVKSEPTAAPIGGASVPTNRAGKIDKAEVLAAQLGATPIQIRARDYISFATKVLLAMAVSILGSASLFSVFTYITPILEDVSGLSPHGVTGALLLFGVGLTLGNIAGGYLADWKLMPSLIGILIALISVLTLFSFTDHRFVPALLTVPVWGALAFALVPLLQTRVVDKASDAPNLASTLIQGTFNLGNAFGAWLGGDLILHGATYTALPWLGAFIALLALGLSGASFWLERDSASTRRDDVLVGLVDGSRS